MVFGLRFYFTFAISVFGFSNVKGDGCIDETLTATKKGKHLTSPGYPFGYKNNLQCKWEIVGPQHSKIKVKILNSDIDGQGNCEGDYLEVLDGSSTSWDVTSLGSVCGVDTPSFTSSGPVITIRFITDGTGTSKGFRLKYHYENSQTVRMAFLYVVGIFVGIVVLIAVLFQTLKRCARKRHNARIELETQYQTQDTDMRVEVIEPTSNNAELRPPPPTYNEVVTNGNINNNKDSVGETFPPPYSTLRISDT
ncbi:uncharacterized protein [Haliotis asinina]|uniref:uncharacterized protein isoform X4 n=1 Tax=Haliotis asinina TaxID=109174 RepID=UPI0035326C72